MQFHFRCVRRCAAHAAVAVLSLAFFVGSTQADPYGAVSVEVPPSGQGDAFVPGIRQVADLPQAYVEEEYSGWINHFQMMEGYSKDPNWSSRLGFKFGRKEFKQLCPDYDGVARLIDDWFTNIS